MPDTISCPYCGRRLQMSEDLQGEPVQCPECQREFVAGDRSERSAEIRAGIPASAPGESRVLQDGSTASLDPDDVSSYRSPQRVGQAAQFMLLVNMVVSALAITWFFASMQLARRVLGGEIVPEAEFQTIVNLHSGLIALNILARIGCAIAIAMWTYRVCANLPALGARNPRFTPKWAVISWFVPIVWFFQPFQALLEVWRKSDPDSILHGRIVKDTTKTSLVLGFWWAAWDVSIMGNYIMDRLPADTQQSYIETMMVGIILQVVTVFAALFAVAVISTINTRQAARAEAILQADWNIAAENEWIEPMSGPNG